MRNDARVQTVIELLGKTINSHEPADNTLSAFFKSNRFIGSKDRRYISETLWGILRQRYTLESMAKSSDARKIVIAYLIKTLGRSMAHDLFTGEKYAPTKLDAGETDMLEPSGPVCEYPAFILEKLKQRFTDNVDEELDALNSPATLDLRVNTLKTSKQKVVECFKKMNIEAVTLPSLGLRLNERVALEPLDIYKDGGVDIQDLGSQMICDFCNVKPGQRILDFCAGAGGKSLSLAILMKNIGEIVSYDANRMRMKDLPSRAERSGTKIIKMTNTEPVEKFDMALVDAPCTSSGTIRRNPDRRWKINQEDIDRACMAQKQILDKCAKLSNRIVYATCSLFLEEDELQIDDFLKNHRDFQKTKEQVLTPFKNKTDGFYMCMLERK